MEQLAITGHDEPSTEGRRKKRRAKAKPIEALAPENPVAEVVVDINAAALDRLFDFSVPERFNDLAQPGCRVRVRFAGRLVNAFIVRRRSESAHPGKLTRIDRVLGPAVLTSEVLEMSRAVADRYAGSVNEVLRDAVPARHVRSEAAFVDADGRLRERRPPKEDSHAPRVEVDWSGYVGGKELVDRLDNGKQARAGLVVAPQDSGPTLVADLIARAGGRAIVVVPDGADVDRFAQVLESHFGERVARLTGDQKTPERYRSFLQIRTGQRSIVVGTRNCVFAPVTDLRLLVVWDDGDDSLAETRAPGWHAREVAALRSLSSNASLVLAGRARSIECARLLAQGWMHPVEPDRAKRHGCARILTLADGRADDPAAGSRIPRFAWEAISQGLRGGPVLVQVGRVGYLPALACLDCGSIARCSVCGGPLGQHTRAQALQCRWCGKLQPDFACSTCGGGDKRAVRIGSARTAEELQAAFPNIPVIVSDSVNGVKTEVDARPHIVVATVGAEPTADGGYQAAVFLDGDAQLAGAHLRGEEQLVRRWFNALSLVKSGIESGVVAVTADPHHRAVQALVRNDVVGWCERELADREETGLPPITRCAAITGPRGAVTAFADACELDESWRVLGPSPLQAPGSRSGAERLVVLAPIADGSRLAGKVKMALAAGADGSGDNRVTVRIDPPAVL